MDVPNPVPSSETWILISRNSFMLRNYKEKNVRVILEFKQAGCLHTISHVPIPSCLVFIKKYRSFIWEAEFYVCHTKC